MGARQLFAWLAAAALVGCGGKEFVSEGGTSTGGVGTGGKAGTGPTGGTGGVSGTGMTGGTDTGGNAGTGMTGGTGGTPCNCPPTTYCHAGTCVACTDLSSLDFAAPEVLREDPSGIRFPRSGDADGSMFYRIGPEGSGHLMYVSSSGDSASPGGPPGSQQSGPLYVDGIDSRFNFIFDLSQNGLRNVRSATWNGGWTNEAEMPPPLSPGGFEDYSPAAATGTGRLYWMSTRDGSVNLRMGRISTGEGDIVSIDVPKRNGSGNCKRTGSDATPWVTPDNETMFFRSNPYDDSCQPIENATDLFAVKLDPNGGAPTGPAIELTSLNNVGTTETDPSLSPDFCTLYFASNVGSSDGLGFKAYRASRR